MALASEAGQQLQTLSMLMQSMLANPDIPVGLTVGQKTLWEVFVKMNVDPELQGGEPIKTTFDFHGFDLMEDVNLVVNTHHPNDALLQMLSLFNFYFNSGCFSIHDNATDRFAAILNTHLHLINQALITQCYALFEKLKDDKGRIEAEVNKESLNSADPGGATFSLEMFRESLNDNVNRMRELLRKIGMSPPDGQAYVDICELLGIPFNEDEMEDFTTEAGKRTLDILMNAFLYSQFFDFQFHLKTEGGGTWDLEDLEGQILQKAFEVNFDETLDEHIFRPSQLDEAYQKQLLGFYTSFWENYLSNVVPVIIIDFFNFTHGLTLMEVLQTQPFIRYLALSTIDEEANPLFNKTANEVLMWFEPDGADEEDADTEQVEQVAAQGGKRRIRNPKIFQFITSEFADQIRAALNHQRDVLEIYTKEKDTRTSVLSTSYFQLFMKERDLYAMFDSHLSTQQQSDQYFQLLSQALMSYFGMSPVNTQRYLTLSKQNQVEILNELFHTDFQQYPLNYFAILNLCLTWVPSTGIPSFKYYLFNTYLNPVNLLGGDHEWYAVLQGEAKEQDGDDEEGNGGWIETVEEGERIRRQTYNNDFNPEALPVNLQNLSSAGGNPLLIPANMSGVTFFDMKPEKMEI